MSNIKYSSNQEAIFDFAKSGQGSAVVVAVAGAGKTTTLVETFNRIGMVRALFLAFNKSIAEELKSRLPAHVNSGTFHSVGFGVWTRFAGRVKVDGSKVRWIMKDNLSPRDSGLYGQFVMKMVSLAKSAGMGFLVPDVQQSWLDLASHFDCAPESKDASIEYGIMLCQMILKKSNEQARKTVDFDDMLFMPLIENLNFPKYDFVCIDEAQDTNGVQQALLKRMVEAPNGRLIAVGDPKQAIYGFRGADSSAMNRIKEEFGCIELPLTVSYRCPQAVVALAQSIVPYIQSADTAPMGLVTHNPGTQDDTGKFTCQKFGPTDAVLCRNTAPLISLAYTLIGKQIPCHILGRDIGKGLVELIKKMNAKGVDALIEKLNEWCASETQKLLSQDKNMQAEAVSDKVASIMVCIGALKQTDRTVPTLIESIERLFDDKSNSLTLCTVHKSKGLEWHCVYILDAGKYMPSKWAKRPWQREQELNLMYVAYTRAKHELAFIDTDFISANYRD